MLFTEEGYLYIILITFLLSLLIVPEVYIRRKANLEKIALKDCFNIIYSKIILALKVDAVYIIILISVATLVLLIDLITNIDLGDFNRVHEKVEPFIILTSFDSYCKEYSDRISFSSILFAYAIGGTVIFSFIDQYSKQLTTLINQTYEIKRVYLNWYSKNSDVLNFDFNVPNEFFRALTEIKKSIETYHYTDIKSLWIYKLFICTILTFYIGGILTLLLDYDLLVNFIFKAFIPLSAVYVLILYHIFTTTIPQTRDFNPGKVSKEPSKDKHEAEEDISKYYVNEKNN